MAGDMDGEAPMMADATAPLSPLPLAGGIVGGNVSSFVFAAAAGAIAKGLARRSKKRGVVLPDGPTIPWAAPKLWFLSSSSSSSRSEEELFEEEPEPSSDEEPSPEEDP